MIKKIHKVWPTVGILVRGDSHFANLELYSWCDKHNVYYILGLTRNSILKEHKTALRNGPTSCHSFIANCFRLMLHSAEFVIMHTFREKALVCTTHANAQFETIRLKLF